MVGASKLGVNMQKLHYYLIAGTVMFRTETMADDEMSKIELNGVMMNKKKDVRHAELSKAQKVLQMHLITKMQSGDEPISPQILDTFISNIVYLGHMTEAEFAAGTEQPAPAAALPRSLQ
jgi:hypothetical protein